MPSVPTHSRARPPGWALALALFAVYAALALLWLSPLSLNLAGHLYDPGDSMINSWALAWDWRALTTAPLELFNANLFYPARNSLAFTEHLLVPALLAAPVLAASHNPILAHNLVLLLTFPLSGLGVYLLCRRLGAGFWAAALAGFFFAFCPYRTLQVSRLQIEAVMWAPYALLFLHRWLAGGAWRDLGGLLLFYVLQALSCGYWALYFGLCLLLAGAWGLSLERRWASGRRWAQIALGALAGALVLAPVFTPYLSAWSDMGFHRTMEAAVQGSAGPLAWLAAPKGLALWGSVLGGWGHQEAYLFPGLAVLALAAAGVALYRGHGRPAPRWLYLGLALFSLAMSLGPEIRLGGLELAGPYRFLYEHAPGFAGLRTVARWGMLYQLFLAVLAGLGLTALLARVRPAWGRALLVGLAALALGAELFPGPMPKSGPHPVPGKLPPMVTWLAARPGPGAVLHLPMDSLRQDAFFRYLSAYHWKPLVNGYTDLQARGHAALAVLMKAPTPELVADLARGGVGWVLVHRAKLDPGEAARVSAALEAMPGLARRAGQWPYLDTVAFELIPPRAPAPALPPGRPLPPAALAASQWPQDMNRALDGDPATAWGTGRAQRAGDFLQATWRNSFELGGVEMNLGYEPQLLPRGLRLELLDASGSWREASFRVRLTPLMAVLARPARVPARYVLRLERPQRALGLRLVLTRDGPWPWVVAGLTLLPPAGALAP